MSYMANPRSFTIKKWTSQLLKAFYSDKHDQIIDRVSTSLLTDGDVQDFGKLLGAIYESGYRKAVKELQGQIEDLGYKVDVKTQVEDIN